jgi:hypothetical protein
MNKTRMTLKELSAFSYEEQMKYLRFKFPKELNNSIWDYTDWLEKLGSHLSTFPETVEEMNEILKNE